MAVSGTGRGRRVDGGPAAETPARDTGGVRVRPYLFDADGEDREVHLDGALVRGLSERQLLWVDVLGRDAAETGRLGELLGFHPGATQHLADPSPHPQVRNYGDTFRVDVQAVGERGGRLVGTELNIVVGPGALMTVHAEDIPFLDEFTAQERNNDRLGQLTPEAFLAALLNWHLTSYLREVEALERHLDEVDEAILGRPERGDFLGDLARHRRRVSELRRLLTDHRDVYATLSRPDFKAIEDSAAADYYDALEERFERALASTEGLREAVLGSFDLYMTSLGQRTNDTMRVLTVATVLLGLWALVASLFGTNFQLPLEKTGVRGFLAMLAALLLLSALVMWAARRRRWW
ncbi:magnesium transporter CorA family protein [Deinococcus aerius]|uniref:magnesium transporter CorA family protein n=1 Tax=Deinococcus aerius TaxID=200253 RepID=UPI001F3349AC|nr:CorA family divalent cation transporter [Deinococcus aerius]